MSGNSGWRIVCQADDLEEGLFGQVLLWIFELLPWLDAKGIRPEWQIRAKNYATPPDGLILPGLFDLSYTPPARVTRTRTLLWTRVAHTSVLGSDWAGTHLLWSRFFKVPTRIATRADAVALSPNVLGLHYRGTDKNRQAIDTNPVTVDDFLTLVDGFLAVHPDIDGLFVASDEPGVLAVVAARFPRLHVQGLGDIGFHKAPWAGMDPDKADRALLDCVLLSRCRYVLKCSSALSGFAKVLNPQLECYRVAACKMFTDVPYFPDAYVPRLVLDDPACRAILAHQFEGDWMDDPEARARWSAPFVGRPRHGLPRRTIDALKYAISVLRGQPRRA